MKLETRYTGRSGIVNAIGSANVAFATNTLREATFFEGSLADPILLREALAALYHVVVSDYKYRPRDRAAFMAWLAEQDRKFLDSLGYSSQKVRDQIQLHEARMSELDAKRKLRLIPFHRARDRFFEYLYEHEYDVSFLLDPVITVHPDEISFEAFSRDESTYARVAAKHELFGKVNSYECGTTNIDFSHTLHGELERMRSYRQTRFAVDPSGFSVTHDAQLAVKEKKIDLPDSWLMGFLQVHSTMAMSLTKLKLAPVDLYNICRYLRRRKAKTSPRSLRWDMTPGQPVRVIVEPWNHVIELTGPGRYEGVKQEIRTWGRDRLQTIGRLLPVCRSIDVYLAGRGMPSIFVADLGAAVFTLALSGWTDNDWTGEARFSLLSRRLDVSSGDLTRVYESLRQSRHATDKELAMRTGLGVEQCRSAASYLCQVGRAMADLGAATGGGMTASGDSLLFRHRDLFFEPFNAVKAAEMATKSIEEADPRAKLARAIFEQDNVRIIARRPVAGGFKVSGSAQGADAARVRPMVHVDTGGQIITASCTCRWMLDTKLTKGPCEHILALRLAHMKRLAEEGDG